MKYAWIKEQQKHNEFHVNAMCDALEVTRSGYYAHKSGSSMLRKTEDERLTILIIESLTMGHNAFSVICESGV